MSTVVGNLEKLFRLIKLETDKLSTRIGTAEENILGKAPAVHAHDDRYYTEGEVNTLLSYKSDNGHTHSQYLTSHQDISGKLDYRYGLASYNGSNSSRTDKDALFLEGFGIYYLNDTSGKPSNPFRYLHDGNTDYYILNMPHTEAWGGQLAFDFRSNVIAKRSKINGSWSGWSYCMNHLKSHDANIDYVHDHSYIQTNEITGGEWVGTKPAGSHNGFGVIHLNTHPYENGGYASQLGFDTNQNRLWFRSANSSESFSGWNLVAYTSDIPTSLPANGGSADYATSSHLLRSYNSGGASHGYDYLVKCQHNVDGDQRFKFQIIHGDGTLTGHQISVDYANSAGWAQPSFANGTLYTIGDDVAIGDQNIGGTLVLRGLTGTPNIRFQNSDGSYYGDVLNSGTDAYMSTNHNYYVYNDQWGVYCGLVANPSLDHGHATLGATNGNLHIDPASGDHGTYIGCYRGNGVIYFGNGNTGTQATMQNGYFSGSCNYSNSSSNSDTLDGRHDKDYMWVCRAGDRDDGLSPDDARYSGRFNTGMIHGGGGSPTGSWNHFLTMGWNHTETYWSSQIAISPEQEWAWYRTGNSGWWHFICSKNFRSGSCTANSTANKTISFGYTFPSVPRVVACYSGTGANIEGNRGSIKIHHVTQDSFQIVIGGSADGVDRAIDWMAHC